MEKGIEDYGKAYRAADPVAAYITINISCPNAFGGEPFTDPARLDLLLTHVRSCHGTKPIFLKMPADIGEQEIDGIIQVARRHRIDGFVCSNLTKNRNNPLIKDANVPTSGGMSGKVEDELTTNMVRTVYRKTRGEFTIMGCGGVFSAEDAYKKIRAGASLIQMITGMIFEGPQVVSEINQGLVKLLKRDGFKNISEAVGADHRTV